MPPKLYYIHGSPPSRSVLLTAKALGIELDLQIIDVTKGEQLTPEYLKINPQHTVPTLQDDDFVIWDSHAINAYLVSKYGNNDSLYPSDLQKRAIIDQRNHFDSGVLFPRFGAIMGPLLKNESKIVPKDKADAVVAAYTLLETFLENNHYVAGKDLSIADFSIVSSISSMNAVVPIASNRFPRIIEWLNQMQQLPYYAEANQIGLEMLAAFIKSKLS